MAKHLETGKKGEDFAVVYLQNLGHHIIARNYRHKRAEVDIISKEGAVLVFTEVKTRSRTDYGLPETDVDEKKQRLLVDAAEEFIHEAQHNGEVRFDVIAILMKDNNAPEIHHIKDAFWLID